MNKWNFVKKDGLPKKKGLPEKDGTYLCAIKNSFSGKFYYDVLSFAKNLYKVDKFDFWDKKGVASFYNHDSEYGYYDVDYVYAWKEIEDPVE